MNLARAEQGSEIAASLAALRQSTARWLLREHDRTRVTTGIPALDDPLAGGWPRGRIGELAGSISSGRTSVATATVAAATRSGGVAAWIDAADAFDPGAAREAGVVLERVLWVRSVDIQQTVRAVEVTLEGGVPLVVVDLVGGGSGGCARFRRTVHPEAAAAPGRRFPTAGRDEELAARIPSSRHLSADARARERGDAAGERGERRSALRLRLARAVERAGAVALVLADRPWAGALAGVTVELASGTASWGGEHGAPRWLVGLAVTCRLGRGGCSEAEGSRDFRRCRQQETGGELPSQAAVTWKGSVPFAGPRSLRISDLQPSTSDLRSFSTLQSPAQRAGA